METVLAFITGCLLAGVAMWFVASRAHRAGERAWSAEKNEALAQAGSARESLARASAEIAALESAQEKLSRQHLAAQGEIRAAMESLSASQAEISALKAELAAEKRQMQEKVALLQEARNTLSDHFQSLANEILEQKGERFGELSKKSLDQLLDPLKTQIKNFQEKAETIHLKDTERQTHLRAELAQMKDLNLRMTEEAHALATALRGEAKVRGNWGEMVLESALERSGLREGKDYRREVSIQTEEGIRRPDVVIYLPQQRHLVIDSKVSLNAYTRYINAEDELERAQALKDHSGAVAARIRELSEKDYFQLPGLNSPEVVFMFIPLESAFVEALRGDESLFEMAIERNVLVATPTTLVTSLNIVRQLWRFEEQNANSAELAMRAGKVYKKLNTFLQSMQKVGSALDSARKAYSTALGQLYGGPGNLIKQASDFKRLGVSVQGNLPPQLVEKAMLEIEFLPERPSDESDGSDAFSLEDSAEEAENAGAGDGP
jgi:DNA recombination protein RmuC